MPTTHRLKLFRRHSSTCTEGYSKDLRILEHDSLKATGRRQCSCTIVAQGALPSGKFLKHPSTGEIAWTEAHKIASLWWSWGDTTPPAEVVKELEQEQVNTAMPITDAVKEFLGVKKAENVSGGIVSAHRQLLELRLLPFCSGKSLLYVQHLDNAKVWSDFRQSWVNLYLYRKPEDGVLPPRAHVQPGTARRLLGQTRQFIRFCIGRSWLTQEWAARRFLKVSSRVEPKEPFTDDDVAAIFDATAQVTDRGKTGQQNSKELLVFCYALRYAGLRISDVVKLERSNLVPRPGDPENFSLHVYMTKTKKWVFIPIPSGDVPGEPDVAATLLSLPLKQGRYFFLGGKSTLRCNIAAWQARLTHLFSLAGGLSVHPHPHRFRHTFAARLLESGMDARDVSEMLGDSLAVVLKHYAKYTTKQQELAAQRWKEVMTKSRKQQLQVIEGKRA